MTVSTPQEQGFIEQMANENVRLTEFIGLDLSDQEQWWIMEFSNRLDRLAVSAFEDYTEIRRFWFRGEYFFAIQQWNDIVRHFFDFGDDGGVPRPPGLPRPQAGQQPPPPEEENAENEEANDGDEDAADDEIPDIFQPGQE